MRGRHVLLVDDVCTTGATLRACEAALASAGAARVTTVVLARADSHQGPEPSNADPHAFSLEALGILRDKATFFQPGNRP